MVSDEKFPKVADSSPLQFEIALQSRLEIEDLLYVFFFNSPVCMLSGSVNIWHTDLFYLNGEDERITVENLNYYIYAIFSF